MKVDREALLKTLAIASVGLTRREILEQSNAFVFTDGSMVTFNGEILTRCPNPLEEVEGAVPADDLMKLLAKFPDEEVEIFTKGEELRIKAKRRQAGISRVAEVHLPFSDVPTPEKWRKVPEKLMGVLLQAARVCGKDETKPSTTQVHVTGDSVEACDNFRLFHYKMDTGFKKEALIPSSSLDAISGLVMRKVSHGGGWIHFQTPGGHCVSIRTAIGDYPDLAPHLKLPNPQRVTLPSNLSDILSRAEVMQDTTFDASVSVTIADGELTLKSKKETGWFKETKKVDYDGKPLRFEVHPKFLEEVFSKKKNVVIGGGRMKLTVKEAVFIVVLEVIGKDE